MNNATQLRQRKIATKEARVWLRWNKIRDLLVRSSCFSALTLNAMKAHLDNVGVRFLSNSIWSTKSTTTSCPSRNSSANMWSGWWNEHRWEWISLGSKRRLPRTEPNSSLGLRSDLGVPNICAAARPVFEKFSAHRAKEMNDMELIIHGDISLYLQCFLPNHLNVCCPFPMFMGTFLTVLPVTATNVIFIILSNGLGLYSTRTD